MRLKQSLGQVFLNDQKYIKKIIASLDIAGKCVLEIGPGAGKITEFISARAKHLYCIEIDPRFYKLLKERFSDRPHIEVIPGDILKFPLTKLPRKLVVFGNIPYQISSDLVKYLVQYRDRIQSAHLTFQREFAQKLTAQPATAHYGFISCYIQYYAQVNKLFKIPAGSFRPIPKVDSSFVNIKFFGRKPYKVKDENFLFNIIRKAFSQKRKKLVNSLSLPKNRHCLAVDSDARAEDVSLEEYILLANKLYPIESLQSP